MKNLFESDDGKLRHLQHVEENIFFGVESARQAILFLADVRDMLAGHSKGKYKTTTKFDGAPSLACGVNPDNGKFFVATKGAFAKTPKLNYTEADIDRNHPGAGLNDKLKIALRYLPSLGMTKVYQGDFMFTSGDLKDQNIDGTDYMTFQPNTIIYAVPKDSSIAKTIRAAKMGIVFHTVYSGKDFASLKAGFNVHASDFAHSKNVWVQDASYKDVTGTATFTSGEVDHINSILTAAGNKFRSINSSIFNRIADNETIRMAILANSNTSIRAGNPIGDTTRHTMNLIDSVKAKYDKLIMGLKQPDAIRKKELEKKALIDFFSKNFDSIKSMYDLQDLLNEAKLLCIAKLNMASNIGTFVRTDSGLRVTSGEGFVVSDHLGNVVKLVDRLEFSHLNFNVAKDWSK